MHPDNPRNPATHLHGGEPRPSAAEIAARFAASRAASPELVSEFAELRALISGSGREPGRGTGLTFTGSGATAGIAWTGPRGRFVLRLERRP